MKRFLQFACALLALTLAISAWMVATEAASAVRKFGDAPKQILAAIDTLPSFILPPITNSLNSAVNESSLRVKETADLADRRIGDTLSVVKEYLTTADARLASIQSQADGVRSDLKPILVSADGLLASGVSLVKDVQDSLDDSYYDVKASIDSATVAANQVAQTTETIRAAVPKFLASSQATNQQIAGITTDLHDMTTQIDQRFFHPPPRTLKQKIVGGIKDTLFTGASLARLAK